MPVGVGDPWEAVLETVVPTTRASDPSRSCPSSNEVSIHRLIWQRWHVT